MNDAFATATELLLADRPPREDVERAGRLFEQESSRGHAQASERCAMFEAFGMARPQSWDRALDYLALAAQQGSRSAQEQLLLLKDNDIDPRVPERADNGFWIGIREGIEIRKRIAPGAKAALSETPRIRVIKSFATAAECRWLIASAPRCLAPAAVFDDKSGQQTFATARDNSYFVIGIGEMNVFTEIIRNRISVATRLPVALFEPSQLLHYAIGQRFKPHYDFLDPENAAYRDDLARYGQRIATFLIYLNSGYSGGETIFPRIQIKFRAQEGDALFFANVTRDGTPDPATLHAGLPPASGEKWIFSQWIRDRMPRN